MKISAELNNRYQVPSLKENYPVMWLLGGNLASFLGDQIYLIALPIIVLSLTGSPIDMGIVGALEKIPNLLQPFSGAISDRINRKQILLFCDFTRGLLIGIMGVLSIFNALSVELIYVTALLMGILSQFYDTAQFAAIPGLVKKDDLHLVNSIESSMFDTAIILGPTLGGFIISLFHPGYALLANSLSFFLSFMAVLNIEVICQCNESLKNNSIKEIINDIKEGFKYVISTKVILFTNIAISIKTFGVTIFLTLMVFHLKNMIKLTPKEIGVLLSIGGIGAILGSLMTTQLIKYFTYKWILFASFFIGGLSIIAFGLSKSYTTLIISNALGTMAASTINPCIRTIRQKYTPMNLYGRVQATSRFMTWILLPFSAIIAGFLSNSLDSYKAIIIGGVISTLSILVFIHPEIKDMEL